MVLIDSDMRTWNLSSCRFRGARDHHSPEKGGRHTFEIVGPLEEGHILAQKPLAHPPERLQQGAQPGPDAFERSVVDFADAVPIRVARPFAVARRVADRRMGTTGRRQTDVCLPLVGVDGGIRPRVGLDKGL